MVLAAAYAGWLASRIYLRLSILPTWSAKASLIIIDPINLTILNLIVGHLPSAHLPFKVVIRRLQLLARAPNQICRAPVTWKPRIFPFCMDFTFSIDTQHCLADIIELLCRSSSQHKSFRNTMLPKNSEHFRSLHLSISPGDDVQLEPACCPGSELEGPALPHNVNVTCRYLVGDRA
jgi:hypothetical protein